MTATDSTARLREIERQAMFLTRDRTAGSAPDYALHDRLIRELHRECPAATAGELAAAEAWIRKCCAC